MHKRKIWLSSGLLIAALAMSLGHVNTVNAASDQKTITIVDKKSGTTVEIDSSDKLFYNSNQMKRGFYEDKDGDNRQVYQWDITPPTISIDSKDVGSGTKESPYLVLDKSQVITGKVTDDGSGVASLILITPSGEITVPVKNDGTFSINVNLLTGTTTEFVLKATDNAGNMSAPSSVFFGTDDEGPNISTLIQSTSSSPKYTHLDEFVIKGNVTDEKSGVESVIVTDPEGHTFTCDISGNSYEVKVPTYMNKKEYKVKALDKLGNKTDITVYIEKANITVTPSNGQATYTGNGISAPGSVTVNAKTGYTIYYGSSNTTCTETKKPEYKNAGNYTTYYKVVTDEGVEKTGSFISTINKAKATLNSSITKTKCVYDSSTQTTDIKLNTNIKNADFDVSTAKGYVKTEIVNGDTLRISYLKHGSYQQTVDSNGKDIITTNDPETVSVKIKENDCYEASNVLNISVDVLPGLISYSAKGYGGSYDGASHTGTLTVNTPGCTVKYGTSKGSYTLSAPPTFSSAGTHNVYYKITKDGYATVESSYSVVLRKVSAMTIATGSSGPNVKSGDIQTTYSDQGYQTHLTVGNNSADMDTTNSSTLNGVRFTREVYTDEIGRIVFRYTAKNTTSSTKTIGIATHADIKIGSNDSAPITPTSTGFSMTDGQKATFEVYTSGAGIITSADGVWFGQYNERTNYHTYTGKSSRLSGVDSGMNINWHGRSLAPGETKTFNFIMDMK